MISVVCVSQLLGHPQSSIGGPQVARLSSSIDRSSTAAETGGDDTDDRREAWRWCLICSGTFPDRECELTPRHVTRGPGKMNCTRKYCTAHVRYEPTSSLVYRSEDGFKGNETSHSHRIGRRIWRRNHNVQKIGLCVVRNETVDFNQFVFVL